MEKPTLLAVPVLLTRLLQLGFACSAYGLNRLFQTFAAPNAGFAAVAAASLPLTAGLLPDGLLVLNATLYSCAVIGSWVAKTKVISRQIVNSRCFRWRIGLVSIHSPLRFQVLD